MTTRSPAVTSLPCTNSMVRPAELGALVAPGAAGDNVTPAWPRLPGAATAAPAQASSVAANARDNARRADGLLMAQC